MATKNKTRTRNTTNIKDLNNDIGLIYYKLEKAESINIERTAVLIAAIGIVLIISLMLIKTNNKDLQQEITDLKEQLYDHNIICKNQTLPILVQEGVTGEMTGCFTKQEADYYNTYKYLKPEPTYIYLNAPIRG